MAVQGVCCVVDRNVSLVTSASQASQHYCNNNDCCVLMGFLCCFATESLTIYFRQSLWSSKCLLQHRLSYKPASKPQGIYKYTWTPGIKVNWEFKNTTIPKYPSDMIGKSSGHLKMPYQVLVLLQCSWKATQSNHAKMPACSQPFSSLVPKLP